MVIAVVAVGVATWALLEPAPEPGAPSYSASEVTDATTSVCQAYDLALRAVSLQTNATPPAGDSGALAATANARLALMVASVNLTDALAAAPATPEGLATPVKQLAGEYRLVATNYLAGVTIDQAPIPAALQRAGTAATTITGACRR
ncbi:hypothetical protein [Williamsia sp.]|uniref:hypothetical protein n=1 Tax=Williamsia sp. TaxID=1872085 RepID=UPI001A279DE2|nr:hypothetical protein [Williamsia sp.]MBJ7291019.1 hypothetical protein [Williamsia sp.]